MIMGLISAILVGWNPNQIARSLEKASGTFQQPA